MNDNIYDVLIIGAGISGLMTAYGLIENNKSIKIAIIDKGNMIENRSCPTSKNISCVHCKVCNITNGFAGAGAFSDGKYCLGTSYGGTLSDEIGIDTAIEYIDNADMILMNFSPNKNIPIYKNSEELKLKCLQHNLRLLDMDIRHFGTDNNYVIMSNLIKYLKDNNVNLIPCEEVTYIADTKYFSDGFKITTKIIGNDTYNTYHAHKVVIATGRNGADFIKKLCYQYNIPTTANAVDMGVRVEMKDIIWKKFSSEIYEPKILYKTKTFEDNTRMFCFNQGGIVSSENNDGIITVNGHSYNDNNKKTDNCNFAILSSIKFTEPFNDPTTYAKSFSQMANLIGDGNVLVQRFGDLIRGRRTNEHRLSQNTVIPTLKATAGDLSLALPHRILTNIIETIYALNEVAPGTANDDTLLYGIESKYYSLKPKHDKNFMIYDNMYLIGDGSGITRGLSQSASMGLYIADKIL